MVGGGCMHLVGGGCMHLVGGGERTCHRSTHGCRGTQPARRKMLLNGPRCSTMPRCRQKRPSGVASSLSSLAFGLGGTSCPEMAASLTQPSSFWVLSISARWKKTSALKLLLARRSVSACVRAKVRVRVRARLRLRVCRV